MKIIDHPRKYKEGTRVLFLKGRNKDSAFNKRAILRTSFDADEFDRRFDELVSIARDGGRIYASAGPRSLERAMRLFRERQLDADYQPDRTLFYRKLMTRWTSCLMHPSAQQGKHFLFDCDTPEQYAMALEELSSHLDRSLVYIYETKNGMHIITRSFHKGLLSTRVSNLIHENPIMLWAY